MLFTNRQIRLATRLKKAGLVWQPGRGQYAFDIGGRIRPGSPFQKGVYYFLDFPCFVEYFGSVEQLAESMAWLPTFEEALEWKSSQMHRDSLAMHLKNDTELDFLYQRLLTELNRSA